MGAGQQVLMAVGGASGPTGTPHSRVYFPSTGAAAVSPSFSGSWNDTTVADRLACVTTKINSTNNAKSASSVAGTSAAFVAWRQYVSAPLTAQTITGTVKGQVAAEENSTNLNATVAVIIRVVSNDGSTVRGTLLAISAPDDLTYEVNVSTGTPVNRRLRDASEATSMALSSLAVLSGDRLCIEFGFRQIASSSSTARTARGYFGDDSGTDLPEDDTATATNNPWLEFSNPVYFQ